MTGLLWLASGYMLGLLVPGYWTVLAWLKNRKTQSAWPGWMINILIAVHFALSLGGLFAAARLGHQLKGAASTLGAVLFAAAGFIPIVLALIIARDWDRRLGVFSDRSDRP